MRGKRNQYFRLHPSIDEVQMRRACLNALSSVISWPTIFGNMLISGKFKDSELNKSGIMLLRKRFLRFQRFCFAIIL